MKNSIGDRFDGRLKTASEAKQQRIERFKAAADDPEKLARRAERHAVAASLEAERKIKFMKLSMQRLSFKRSSKTRCKKPIVRLNVTVAMLRDAIANADWANAEGFSPTRTIG
jgi:hypothetical protein